MDFHHRVKFFDCHVLEGNILVDTGIVNERIDMAERFDRASNDGLGALAACDIVEIGQRDVPPLPSMSTKPTSFTTTWAPRLARSSAWARPIPRPAPVTITTLPSNLSIYSLHVYPQVPPDAEFIQP
jgi:hypothetical protein